MRRLVVDGDVVHHVLAVAVAVHALDAFRNQVRHLVRKGRIVGDHRRICRRQNRRMTIHMLQALTKQGGASRSRADDETARHLVASGPEVVARALETEHRVEDVHRDHRLAVRRIGRTGRDEGRRGTILVDALVQELAVRRLTVRQLQVVVHRDVVLALRVVNLQGREPGVQAERARLIRNDRHHSLPDLLITHQRLKRTHQRHRRGNFLLTRVLEHSLVGLLEVLLLLQRRELHTTLRQVPAELLAALLQILDLRRVLARVVVRRQVRILLQLLVADRHALLVAEALQVLQREVLHLVRRVTTLKVVAQAVTLNRVRQNDRRLALGLQRTLVRRIDLAVVVAAAAQRPDLLIRHVLDQLQRPLVAAEEVLAHKRAIIGLKRLVITIRSGIHDVDQRTVLVLLQQLIPLAAPHNLDHIPASANEEGLQLLDDLAVAADGAVETLQVAVDHEGQVIQAVQRRHVQ